MLWYNFPCLTPFSCLALVLLICGSSLVVILVICVRLMSLMGHLVLFLLLLVRLLRGSTKHAWYAVFFLPVLHLCDTCQRKAAWWQFWRKRGVRCVSSTDSSAHLMWASQMFGKWNRMGELLYQTRCKLQDKVENGDGSSEFACVPVGVRRASQCRIHTRWRGCVTERADSQLEPQISTQKMTERKSKLVIGPNICTTAGEVACLCAQILKICLKIWHWRWLLLSRDGVFAKQVSWRRFSKLFLKYGIGDVRIFFKHLNIFKLRKPLGTNIPFFLLCWWGGWGIQTHVKKIVASS